MSEDREEIELEINELQVVAMNWIDATIAAARIAGKYGPYSWLKETQLRQVMRATAHLNTYLQKKFGELPDNGEDDLAHAVTRLAFVGARDDRRAAAAEKALNAEPKPFAGAQWLAGVHRIEDERNRQVTQEGWTAEHDDMHTKEELIKAAITYLLISSEETFARAHAHTYWPWAAHYLKPTQRIRDLTKAGALIAAEIDRLQRLENQKGV